MTVHQVEATLVCQADTTCQAGRTMTVSAILIGEVDPAAEPVQYESSVPVGDVPEGTINLGTVILTPWG